MSPGPVQIIIIIALLVILFGRGKISSIMGDVAKGIKTFKKGMADDDDEKPNTIDKPEDTSQKD
tara:strand:- start:1556 stop:1747 length:192 start_codon:yes stop_codon:yes gene_type:complete